MFDIIVCWSYEIVRSRIMIVLIMIFCIMGPDRIVSSTWSLLVVGFRASLALFLRFIKHFYGLGLIILIFSIFLDLRRISMYTGWKHQNQVNFDFSTSQKVWPSNSKNTTKVKSRLQTKSKSMNFFSISQYLYVSLITIYANGLA